ncbi:MAG: endonuclease/exonuclease/phosphatase family protein [Euryarchaeota archaeon]|nr:endonuclease/exonuclease/phosphatase family protein [Euryarchaeota archaeon]
MSDGRRYGRRDVLKIGGGALIAPAGYTVRSSAGENGAPSERSAENSLVFAEYNIELLTTEKAQAENDEQLRAAAEVVQTVPEPDVLLVCELDNNFQQGKNTRIHNGEAFLDNYLREPQRDDLSGVDFEYFYAPESNTGVPSGMDYYKSGEVTLEPGTDAYANDCYGYGEYPGQYAMGIYSKYPIDPEGIRTFRKFRWKNVPNDKMPLSREFDIYLTGAERKRFRLSSKTHADVPIRIGDRTVHAVIAHPTPPVFDGPENLNGRRCHDENKLIGDLIRGEEYLYDDDGARGGLPTDEAFVLMGDMNAEPGEEENFDAATTHLLENPRINAENMPTSEGGREEGNEFITSDFGKQVDYVLPSMEFDVLDSAVVWPSEGTDRPAFLETVLQGSDHFMIWSELTLS